MVDVRFNKAVLWRISSVCCCLRRGSVTVTHDQGYLPWFRSGELSATLHIWRCEQGRLITTDVKMATSGDPVRLLYVPRERRIPHLRGTPEDELSPEEWASEVRRAVSARSMGGLEGADYAISHLDGNARREVLALPPDDVETAKLICVVVCREFGDQRSAAALREALYGRNQQTQESVRDFGHAIQRLHERLVAKYGPREALAAAQLRDRLIEGLIPGPLRRHLRRLVIKDATMSFRAARDEALRYEREDADDALLVASARELHEGAPGRDERVSSLVQTMLELCKQMADIQARLPSREADRGYWPRGRGRNPGQRRNRTPERRRTAGPSDLWWNCEQAGHFAAHCAGNDQAPL